MVQENNIKKKLLIICGATATGKTGLAIECARLLKSEVISADSMNVYKGLNIGTAKPTEKEKDGIIHHAIDIISPFDTFSVGDYKEFTKPIVEKLLNDGKIPVICGGTGFYVNSLIYDLSYGNETANLEIRDFYKEKAEKYGNQYVYDVLLKKDPVSASKIHVNDLKRVIRALEIAENGKLKSQLNDSLSPVYDYDAYCIDYSREELYERIDRRVDEMIKKGLIDEVKGLINEGVSPENQSMQGIGYKEIIPYLNGEKTLEETVELIKLNTRHYAKRQITFFKKLPNLKHLKKENTLIMAKRIVEDL